MMNTAPVLISAKTRQQAMDWSLVLASQGIEVSVEQIGEERFALQVAAADSSRAFQILKLYHKETRDWTWWLAGTDEGKGFDPLAMFWILALIIWYAVSARFPGVVEAGVMNSERFMLGDWWLLFTAVTLHHDLAHLAANSSIGLLFFGLAAARYGIGLCLLASFVAGVLGNVASWLVYPGPYNSLGASGMVMGAVGLIIARPHMHPAAMFRWKALLMVCSAGVMLFLLVGANPEADVVAHAGGFVSGLLLGWLLRRWKSAGEKSVQNQALIVFLFLLILPWCLTL